MAYRAWGPNRTRPTPRLTHPKGLSNFEEYHRLLSDRGEAAGEHMACPFFYPTHALDERSQPRGRMPLGEAQAGECRAGMLPDHPSAGDLVSLCNSGYVRGKCPRFPAGAPDAVRFVVQAHSATAIRIAYSCERDHRPVEAGTLEFTPEGGCREPHGGTNIERQALAYVQAYLRACLRRSPGGRDRALTGASAPSV